MRDETPPGPHALPLDRVFRLAIAAAVLATVAATSGIALAYQVFKPLALLLLIAAVARHGWRPAATRGLLLVALGCSLLGDVLLLADHLFLAGLVAFLVAHLCYLALFRQGVGWLPKPLALVATLLAGALLYAVLFPRLGPVLRIAVAVYTAVIALMAAQAIGRAMVLRDPAASGVALGALAFMTSDALLAVDRFAVPLPLAPLWILGTYYLAQVLIARNAVTIGTPAPRPGQ